MSAHARSEGQPLVSVVTPVYNVAEYLARCIESVLGQSYRNFEYLLVNNCSTDESLEIAERYARRDSRIRISNNKAFLAQVDNFNGALLQISPESRYCKVVNADDWIFPNCIEKMVEVAEAYPSVGIVGCHYLHGEGFNGTRYPSPRMDGRTACLMNLVDCVPLFGSPTNLLMRSSIVHGRRPLYDENSIHWDKELCYVLLQEWDFGYVQETLAYLRPPFPDSVSGPLVELGTFHLYRLVLMRKYGPAWLFPDEREYRRYHDLVERQYAAALIRRLLQSSRKQELWRFHSRILAQCGYKLSWHRLIPALSAQAARRFLGVSAPAVVAARP